MAIARIKMVTLVWLCRFSILYFLGNASSLAKPHPVYVILAISVAQIDFIAYSNKPKILGFKFSRPST